jgi:hypothetical protein
MEGGVSLKRSIREACPHRQDEAVSQRTIELVADYQ